MDKDIELRSALLYFTDEAIGFRKSVHHFHRWLETKEEYDLIQLIVEVGREYCFDFWPLLNSIKNNNEEEGLIGIQTAVRQGMYVPTAWATASWDKTKPIRLTPLDINLSGTDLESMTTKLWMLSKWNTENLKDNGTEALPVLALAQQFLLDAKTDFNKFFQLAELIIGTNSLLSCITDSNILRLAHTLGNEYYPKQQEYLKRLATAISNNQDLNWKDALSRNQIKSKKWLINKLDQLKLLPKSRKIGDVETTTMIVGGWVGILPFVADMEGKNLDSVINVDIDITVHPAANELNIGFHNNFKNSASDIREIDFLRYKKLLLIDTIVEHFENHGNWVATLPKGTLVVLQGNNMFDVPDHVNCHQTLEDFVKDCGLNTIIWAGELNLYKCTRFMAIGKV